MSKQGLPYTNNRNGREKRATAVEFDKNQGGLNVAKAWKKMIDSNFISIQYQSVNPKMIKHMALNNIDIMVWTVDKKEDIQKIKKLSDDIAIITNYPDRSF